MLHPYIEKVVERDRGTRTTYSNTIKQLLCLLYLSPPRYSLGPLTVLYCCNCRDARCTELLGILRGPGSIYLRHTVRERGMSLSLSIYLSVCVHVCEHCRSSLYDRLIRGRRLLSDMRTPICRNRNYFIITDHFVYRCTSVPPLETALIAEASQMFL